MSDIRDLKNRVMLTVARAVVNLIDDSKKLQTLQTSLLKREVRDNIERFQDYGFTSVPHPGAEGVVVFVGGNRDLGLCIAVDDRRYRMVGLEQGEVAIYTDEGDNIHLKRGRVIEVTTQTFRVNAELIDLNAPLVTAAGDVQAEGDILDQASSSGRTMAVMRDIYNEHDHGGVQPGSGDTADPNQAM